MAACWISSGCGSENAGKEAPLEAHQPVSGGTLVIGTPTDIAGVNQLGPRVHSFTQTVLNRLFLHLVEERPDHVDHPPTFGPQIATDWEWSDDHLVLDLKLRDDLVWSDGKPITAEDVVWTWTAQTSPDISWENAFSKENIVSIEAIDRHSLRVTYTRANDAQLYDLNEGVILPKHAWSQLPFDQWSERGDWFVDHLVVSGPFVLEDWQRQQQIILARNDKYFAKNLPYLERVIFRIVPQSLNRIGQLLSGELDFVGNLPVSEVASTTQTNRFNIKKYWASRYDFVCWNLAKPLFSDPETRRALTMAIDRQTLIDALWFGHARIATSPIPSSIWAHAREIQPWPYDPDTAKEILARQGWSDTDGDGVIDSDGRPFAFDLLINAAAQISVDAGVMIQEQLRRIGIEANVSRIDFGSLAAKVSEHDFDAFVGGWSIDTSLDLSYAFHTDAITGALNFGSFTNPQVDRLIDASEREPDTALRGEMLREIQAILHHEQPYTFLWEPQRLVGVSTQVRGAEPNSMDGLYRIESWWMIPEN